MLSGARLSFFQWPWLALSPTLVFLVAIVWFNILAIGLRTYLGPM